jgi:putative FmdB family regulatory protein
MPLYNYECPNHGRISGWAPMSESAEPAQCPTCGVPAPRALSRPRVVSDYEGYECPVTGSWIEGRAAHEENLKRTGCRILETGEVSDMERRRARADSLFEAGIDETVERTYDGLSSDQKETLANEVASGVTATVTRS